jgi:hypothetical protein
VEKKNVELRQEKKLIIDVKIDFKKIDNSPDGQFSFMNAYAVLYRIESKGFCNVSVENQIESKPIRFDSPDWLSIDFQKPTSVQYSEFWTNIRTS